MGYIKMSAFRKVAALLADAHLTGYHGQDNIRISYADLFEQLGLDSAGADGAPIRFEGNQLPSTNNVGEELTSGNWAFLQAGETYTNINGGDPITAPEGYLSIAIFDDTTGTWRLQELAQLPGKAPIFEWDLESENPLAGMAIKLGFVSNFIGGEFMIPSADDVKELNERVQFYDRPDLPFHHYIVGKNKNIIDRLLSEKADRHRFLPEGFTIYTIDRPDLGAVILVDKNNKILGHSGSNSGGGDDDGGETKARVMLPMFNPKEQQSFNVPAAGDSSALSDYGVLIDEYDSLLEEVNVGAEYMTKRTIGTSSVGDLPIEMYSLKPEKPLAKVLLLGGTHAAEKMYIDVLRHFCRDVAANWESDPFLNFLRWNIHIDVIPCRIPSALKNTKRARGTRCAPETEPIPFTWSKTGNVVTLTFDIAQFPDDGFLTGATYFTSVPASALVNRQAVHVSLSSDETAVPISTYPIASVISGNSITFHTPETGGAGSGTGFFEVWVDPNRNMSYSGSNAWFTYNSNATQQYTDDGVFYTYMVSKGTRPQSLRDNRAFMALIDEEDYDWVVDGHSPAGDNDVRYDSETGFIPDRLTILSQTGAFVNSTNNVHDSSGSFGSTPYTSASMRDYGTNFWTIEWGSGLNNATGVQVRNAYRWLTIILTNAIHNLLNK